MTALTTPSTWTAGQSVAAAPLNAQVRDNMLHVTEIQNWSPTVTQLGSVSRTVVYGRYWMAGKRVHAQCHLSATGAGTTANAIVVSLPVTGAAALPSLLACGTGWIYDTSTAAFYQGAVLINTTTTVGLRIDGQPGYVGAAPSFALASGDLISFAFDYEAA